MSETKQVLFELQVDISKSVEQLAEYEIQLEGVNEEIAKYQQKQKSGEQLSASERAELIRLKEVKKALQKEMADQSRQVQNAIIAEGKYKDTLKGLCAELSSAKDKLRAMKLSGEENSKAYAEQSEYVGKLNDKIKEMEAAYGVHTRNVGNYEMAVSSSKDRVAELVAELARLTAEHKENTPEFEAASAALDEYSLQLQSNNKTSLEFAQQGLTSLVGAFTVVTMVMGQDTEEGKKMAAVMAKLQVAVTALSALMAAYQAIEKKGLIQKIATTLQVKAGALALKMQASAQTAATGATVAGTVAQKALNKAMAANPIGLIVAGVVALVSGLVALVSWLLKSSEAEREAQSAMKAYEDQCRKTENALAFLEAKELERSVRVSKQYQDEIAALMQKGATQTEIDNKIAEMEDALAQITIESAQKRIEENRKYLQSALANYEAQQKYLNELIRKKGADAKASIEQAQVAAEAYKKYLSIVNAVNNDVKAVNDATFASAQRQRDKETRAIEKAYEKRSKLLQAYQSLVESVYNKMGIYIYDETKSAEENAEARYLAEVQAETRMFEFKQKMAKKKLALDRKNKKITEDEYKYELSTLKQESDAFYLQQSENLAEHTRSLLQSAIDLAGGKTVEKQIEAVTNSYKNAREQINRSETLSAEEKAFYIAQLAEKEAEEIKQIRLNSVDETHAKIEKEVGELYRYDVRQFSESETERLQLDADYLRKMIAQKKKAGLNTIAEEKALLQTEAALRASALNDELASNWKNLKKQYDLKKDYIEKELQLEELSAQRRAELEEELATITAEKHMKQIEAAESYASQAMEMLSSINDLANSLGDREVAKAEEDNNAQKKSLDKRLKAGLISQKQYDKEVAKLDDDLDKKKAEIAKKQAIREKALSAFQIGLNTAMAIMKIWAEVPKVDFGASTIALTAMVAALGAAQLAAALATPIPTARKGGLVQGATHEQGGVLINTEGDERIISANPSKAFPELLNLISYIGKHAGIPDTGYGMSAVVGNNGTGHNIDMEELSAMISANIASALADLKIYTAITDVREADKNYTIMENNAKL